LPKVDDLKPGSKLGQHANQHITHLFVEFNGVYSIAFYFLTEKSATTRGELSPSPSVDSINCICIVINEDDNNKLPSSSWFLSFFQN